MSKLKKKYFQTYKDSYSEEFPCIQRSQKGEKFVFCLVCRCDFNIAHGGKHDVSTHVNCPKHVGNVKSQEENKKISSFFNTKNTNLDVTKAECLFVSFLVEHNIPLSAADHAGGLFRNMFTDSNIAKQFTCARTKTTCILNEMASNTLSEVVVHLQTGPFSVATDGSNDTNEKLYPIVVTFYDSKQGKIVSTVLSIPNLEGDSTGRNIGQLILSQLESNGVPLNHCVAFCADNAPVMVGKKNGVAAFLKERHEEIVVIGCACHLLNLAAEKAASSLPVNVDEILVDIFYYMEKSAKRKERLARFQDLHCKESKKVLKHVVTRWLSLARSLTRLVSQWEPLLSFFKEEVLVTQKPSQSVSMTSYKIPLSIKKQSSSSTEKGNQIQGKRELAPESASSSKKIALTDKKFDKPVLKNQNSCASREEKLFLFLSSNLNKALCAFLLHVMPYFEKVNVILQAASPQIHILRELLMNLLRDILVHFVKPSVLKGSPLLEVQYHLRHNQKDDGELMIGSHTTILINVLESKEKHVFYSSVRKYFITACDYMINKFPFKSEVLKHAEVARLKGIEIAQFSSVRYFVKLFPVILPVKKEKTIDLAIDELHKQFANVQVDDISAVVDKDVSIDVKWAELSDTQGVEGVCKYDRISRVMLSILSIPHSNAECERIFSLVKKNRTEFRSSMSRETLQSISVLKCKRSGPCYNQNFSSVFLQAAKKATSSSLQMKQNTTD